MEGQLVSGAQPIVELAQSAAHSLLHRLVVTEDQDTGLDLQKTENPSVFFHNKVQADACSFFTSSFEYMKQQQH